MVIKRELYMYIYIEEERRNVTHTCQLDGQEVNEPSKKQPQKQKDAIKELANKFNDGSCCYTSCCPVKAPATTAATATSAAATSAAVSAFLHVNVEKRGQKPTNA